MTITLEEQRRLVGAFGLDPDRATHAEVFAKARELAEFARDRKYAETPRPTR